MFDVIDEEQQEQHDEVELEKKEEVEMVAFHQYEVDDVRKLEALVRCLHLSEMWLLHLFHLSLESWELAQTPSELVGLRDAVECSLPCRKCHTSKKIGRSTWRRDNTNKPRRWSGRRAVMIATLHLVASP